MMLQFKQQIWQKIGYLQDLENNLKVMKYLINSNQTKNNYFYHICKKNTLI